MSDNIFNPYGFLKAYSNLHELMMMQGKTATNIASLRDMGTYMLDFWATLTDNKNTLSDGKQQIFNRMAEQAYLFNLFGEQLLHLVRGVDNSKPSVNSKGQYEQLEDYFDQLKTVFSQQRASMTTTIQQLLNTAQLPFAKKLTQDAAVSSLSMPYRFLQQMFDQHLSMPAIGCTRELQEQLSAGVRLLDAYFKALDAFTRAYGAVEIEVLDHLKSKLIRFVEQGETISSIKQLYIIWVDTHQAVYTKFISSKEYSRLYGNLINSLMRYKKHYQQCIDPLLAMMNISSRDSVNATILQQQQSRRSLQTMQQEFKESQAKIKRLEQQINALKETLRHLGVTKEKVNTSTKRPTRTSKKKSSKSTTIAKN